MTTIVDSNVLIDVFGQDPQWWRWSLRQLESAADRGPVLINDIVYSETSARFLSREATDKFIGQLGIRLSPLSRDALFLAGKAFVRYRRARGTRTGMLADFLIGAHAADLQVPLLTRDPRRYRTYFPDVTLIGPD